MYTAPDIALDQTNHYPPELLGMSVEVIKDLLSKPAVKLRLAVHGLDGEGW
jgi:hypothetical protein